MKFNRISTVMFFIFLFTVAFLAKPFLSVAADVSRDDIIQKEFDCITKKSSSGNDLGWADVCYKSDQPEAEEVVEEVSDESFAGNVVDEEALRKYQNDLREYRKAKMREAGIEPVDVNEESIEESSTIASVPVENAVTEEVQEEAEPVKEKVSRKRDREKRQANVHEQENKTSDGEEVQWAKVTPPVDAGAAQLQSNDEKNDSWVKADWKVLSGYRRDKLIWNIASDVTGLSTPNVLSELKWDPLRITQIKTQGTLTFADRFVLDGKGAYGWIYDGDNQDSDYLGDNRTLEFSRSNNETNDDDVFDISAGGGIRFPFVLSNDDGDAYDFCLTVLGGYSYHQQNLIITDGLQTIPATGAFNGLRSTYETEWKGPWAGGQIDVSYRKLSGYFRLEYHDVDYYAQADWNLRSDFQHPKSYEHIAEGTGLIYSGGVAYHINNRWRLNAEADFYDWESDSGLDRTFLSNGTTAETRLNEVRWESLAVMLGLTYSFF